jgi:serine/threonine-protein kinase RsbW
MGHSTITGQESAEATTEIILERATRILDSTKESVDRTETEAIEAARRGGFRQTIVERIGLAVREIMINSVIHGNGCNPHKKVVVTISRTPDKLKIVISDEGEGFDPDQLPDPLSPEGVLRGSGRGVFLARAFMDELEVRRDAGGWTTVTMTKFVDSVGAG